ncbi:MAG: carboxypeptidase-like regulatory domain-containing protein [Bacteroidetes bacterium]|uniref:Carboxypeptidase-like regulatory domain-containing protein n=1 Tax=Candidatus Cryptobacteroides avistercoris TaxID=2840758 RepID=A0A9D9IZ42_9BACT|nr:carboxypeptidase-like regulatory domain-containing protein [Candidatus Cryptobacteroides avistercoris]
MLKYLPLFLLLALCTGAAAQDSLKTIVGHITDRDGHSIEYVAVGIPGRNIGTVSDSEGIFSLELPDTTDADLVFFHVSYKEKSIPSAEIIAADGPVTVILEENRLAAAVVTPGKKKDRRLVGRGARVPGGVATMEPSSTGMEIGSVIEVRKEFTVRKISFEVLRNALPGCVLGVNIYRMEGSPATFDNVLTKPIYCNIPVSEEKNKCQIEPEETVILSPGKYFIALALVDCDRDLQEKWKDKPSWGKDERIDNSMTSIDFPLYLKSGYKRSKAMQDFESIPIGTGLTVEGTENQP